MTALARLINGDFRLYPRISIVVDVVIVFAIDKSR